MRYLLIALLLMSAACATTKVNETKPDYSHLTVEDVTKQCETKNNWAFGVLGARVLAYQFNTCLGRDDLILLGGDVEAYTDKVRRSTLELAVLHFQIYLKEKVDPTKIWTTTRLKEEISNGGLVYFYKITSQSIDCTGGTCKRTTEE